MVLYLLGKEFTRHKYQFCIFEFVLYCKRKPLANFHKKNIDIWGPWNFLKMKTLTHVHRRVLGARAPKLWIWISKIMPDLWSVDLFCPIKKISTLHPYVQGFQDISHWCFNNFLSNDNTAELDTSLRYTTAEFYMTPQSQTIVCYDL